MSSVLAPTATPAQAAAVERADFRALPVLLLGIFLAVLDFFVVNVALPSIDRSLHAGPALLELVVAGYGVGYACTLVAGGRLGDLHGRRRIFIGGMLAFTAASFLCGVAPSAATLVAARVAQGVAAGLMVPQVLATIQATYNGRARERALGVYGAVLGGAMVAGQVVGGSLVQLDADGLGWRPIFLVNVPLGIAGVVAASRLVPESRHPRAAHIDVWGTVLLAAAVVLLLLPLALGRDEGWPAWTFAALLAAPLAGGAFVASQERAAVVGRTPLLPLGLLGVPAARRGLVVALLAFVANGAYFLTTAVSLQDGRGFTPLRAAATLVPMASTFLLVSLAASRIARRLGGGRAIVVGGAIWAVGLAAQGVVALGMWDRIGPLQLALPTMLTGVGAGLVVVRLVGVVLAGVPAELAGAASGSLMTTIQLSLASGAAVFGTLWFSVSGDHGAQAAFVVALALEAALVAVAAVVARGLRV
jgi:MFS family permease